MALTIPNVELPFYNVVAGVPISVAIQTYDASTIYVEYGKLRYPATAGTDFNVALNEEGDYLNFTLTPTSALITKLATLLLIDSSEQNVIHVFRELPFTNDFTETDSFVRRKIVREFDDAIMRIQQVQANVVQGQSPDLATVTAAVQALSLTLGMSVNTITTILSTYLTNDNFTTRAPTILTEGNFSTKKPTVLTQANLSSLVPALLYTSDISDQATAEAGTNNTKLMTPLRTKQLITASLGGGGGGGSMTPLQFGAIGNGNPANVAADQAGLQAAVNYLCTHGEVRTLDLAGRVYYLNNSITFPSDMRLKRITNGEIRVIDSFNGTTAMFEMSATNIYFSQVDNIIFTGFNSSGHAQVGYCIRGFKHRDFHMSECYMQGYIFGGLQLAEAIYGQNAFIGPNNKFVSCFGSDVPGSVATGVDIYGGDNHVHFCIFGENEIGCRFRLGSNSITGCHLWTYDGHIGGKGVVLDRPSHCTVDNNYIDSVALILDGYAGLLVESCSVTNNRFLTAPHVPMPSGFACIVTRPRSANQGINGLIITSNTFRTNMNVEKSFGTDTSFGTIDNNNISNTTIGSNSFYGIYPAYSHPYGDIVVNNSNSGSYDFTNILPFGIIRRIRAASFESGVSGSRGWRLDKNVNVVSAVVDGAAYSAVIHVQATINNDEHTP